MTPRFLLDASVTFAAASGEIATLARLSRKAVGEVATSSIVYAELLAAASIDVANARFAENLALLAQNIEILPFDRAAAARYGALMRELAPKRRRMLDRLVAAQALASGLTLVTLAPQEVEDIRGLQMESWAPGAP
jgi:tRNA(fMet)-specific endonuclease VapC